MSRGPEDRAVTRPVPCAKVSDAEASPVPARSSAQRVNAGAAEQLAARSLLEVRRVPAKNLPFAPEGPGLQASLRGSEAPEAGSGFDCGRALTCEIPEPAFELRLEGGPRGGSCCG